MGEVRLTFESRDFGATSQVLIERGISFRVEPVKQEESEPARPTASMLPTAEPRRTAKPSGKKASRTKAATRSTERPLSGADRLREAIARNLSTVGSTAPAEPPTRSEE